MSWKKSDRPEKNCKRMYGNKGIGNLSVRTTGREIFLLKKILMKIAGRYLLLFVIGNVILTVLNEIVQEVHLEKRMEKVL